MDKRTFLSASQVLSSLLILAALLSLGCERQQQTTGKKTRVVVYTAIENEELAECKPLMEKAMPDLEIVFTRLSTGDITARLLAEKNNPQADAIWCVAASSMMIFEREGMLDPYAPEGLESILPTFKSPKTPPTWVGMDAYVTAFCVNTVRAKELNLPIPTSWADLTNSVYKGHIVMPNPASSGTGFMSVSSVLQGMGEAKGWEYLRALHQNMAQYTKSGSKPAKMAADGEYPIAISIAFVGAKLKSEGAPLEIVLPNEGAGYEVEANALVKGAKNADGARRFLDWAISDEAMSVYAKYLGIMAKPGFTPPEGMPENVSERLFKMDFQWSADNRDAVLEKWATLFGG